MDQQMLLMTILLSLLEQVEERNGSGSFLSSKLVVRGV